MSSHTSHFLYVCSSWRETAPRIQVTQPVSMRIWKISVNSTHDSHTLTSASLVGKLSATQLSHPTCWHETWRWQKNSNTQLKALSWLVKKSWLYHKKEALKVLLINQHKDQFTWELLYKYSLFKYVFYWPKAFKHPPTAVCSLLFIHNNTLPHCLRLHCS